MDALEISTFGEPSDVVEAEPGSSCATWDYQREQRAFQAAGWDHTLARLVIAAEGGDPGTDPWATAPMG
jgi:hypothetical protein